MLQRRLKMSGTLSRTATSKVTKPPRMMLALMLCDAERSMKTCWRLLNRVLADKMMMLTQLLPLLLFEERRLLQLQRFQQASSPTKMTWSPLMMTMKSLSRRGQKYFLKELNQQRSRILRLLILLYRQEQAWPRCLCRRLTLLPAPPPL